jgi:TPR repeat protein
MEESDTRRQRPRVSESEAQGIAGYERRIAALESQVQVRAQGIAGYERRIAALEARVQQISAQTDVVVGAPQTEAERLLSAVLADIARLSAHRVVDGAAPELEAERLLAAGQYADATEALQRAIRSGHLPSRALLAWIFMFAREGIAKNQNTAIELVQEGTRLGCHHCQGVLAYCLWNCHNKRRIVIDEDGIVGDEDPPPSCAEMALASSTRGSAYGHFVLGILADESETLGYFRRAAEQHLDAAQYELGKFMHQGGFCASSQYDETLRWFQLAAAQGHPDALFAVGLMHELGHGVPADGAEAIRWYRRAAAAGHHRAAHCVQKLQVLP